jgi:hypothetical protein
LRRILSTVGLLALAYPTLASFRNLANAPAIPPRVFAVGAGVIGVLAVATAILIVWRAADDQTNRLLAAGLGFAVGWYGLAFAPLFAPWPELTALQSQSPLLRYVTWLLWALSLSCMLRFSVRFPAPLLPEDLQHHRRKDVDVQNRTMRFFSDIFQEREKAGARLRERLPKGLRWIGSVVDAYVRFDDRLLDLVLAGVNSRGLWVLTAVLALPMLASPTEGGAWVMVSVSVWMVLALTALWNFAVIRYATSPPEDQRRILGMALALVPGTVATVVPLGAFVWVLAGDVDLGNAERLHSLGLLASVLLLPPLTFALATLVLAVFFHGAVDPGLVLQKTTVYGALAGALLFGFGALENVLEDIVLTRIGLPPGSGTWLAGGMMAVAFKPLYEFLSARIGGWLDPRLPGKAGRETG